MRRITQKGISFLSFLVSWAGHAFCICLYLCHLKLWELSVSCGMAKISFPLSYFLSFLFLLPSQDSTLFVQKTFHSCLSNSLSSLINQTSQLPVQDISYISSNFPQFQFDLQFMHTWANTPACFFIAHPQAKHALGLLLACVHISSRSTCTHMGLGMPS